MDLASSTAAAYVDQAFSRMLAVAERVGDPLVNERPPGPATNAIAALIVHCCGLTEYWIGHLALGRPAQRGIGAAEFSQERTLDELRVLVAAAVEQTGRDLDQLVVGRGENESARRHHLPTDDRSDAALVLHVLEELYQHLGHIELTADALGC